MAIRYVDRSSGDGEALEGAAHPVSAKAKRADIRAAAAREVEIEIRGPVRAKRGRPRLEDKHKTLTAREPWNQAKPPMSRSTWYRRMKENR